MFHLSQLPSSLLLLSTILLYHIVMLIILLYYTAILRLKNIVCGNTYYKAIKIAGKGLTSWLSFVVSSVSLSLSHWYPGSGVVLDCIDS